MKYQVITDNLEWIGVKYGDTAEYDKGLVKFSSGIMYSKEIIDRNPGWFRREDEKEFTKADMIDFATYHRSTHILRYADKDFNLWYDRFIENKHK